MNRRILRKFFKVLLILMAATIFSFSLSKPAFAARQKKAKAKAIKPSVVELEKRQAMLKAAQEKLNYTAWQVRFMSIGEKKKESFNDELSFIDNKFASKKMLREGFSATSVTLSLKGENIVVWETMQTDAKGNMAFWKGEIEGERMRGVLSRQPEDKPVADYTFVSVSKEEIQ